MVSEKARPRTRESDELFETVICSNIVFWFCFISDCFCHFNCFIQSLEVFLKFYLSILALYYFLTSITRQHSERLSWTSISIFHNSTCCQIEKKVKCPPFSNKPNLLIYIYSIHGYKIETRSRWHAENVNKLNSNRVTRSMSNYRVCVKRKTIIKELEKREVNNLIVINSYSC